MAYVDVEALDGEHPGVWQLLGHVAEELLLALVPLDGVEQVVLQVVGAGQRDSRARRHRERNSHAHVPQPAHSYNNVQ